MVAPVITEGFTLLSCDPSTTLGREGCAEHDVLDLDRRIDVKVATVLGLLADPGAKERFVTAEHAWLNYRDATCASRSDQYLGGSEGPVIFGQCSADVNRQHLSELTGFEQVLSPR
jgi:uncharacterized protein YecT (DUF1311 family)